MPALPILKQACLEALETAGEPGDPNCFFSIVDPGSVLELVQIAETSIIDEEVTALHQVIGQLSDYIRRSSATPELTASKAAAQITFKHVTDRYIRDELPKTAPATRKDNLRELAKLLEFFEDVPLDEIDPIYVRQYIDWRGQTAKIRANREKALFSHI